MYNKSTKFYEIAGAIFEKIKILIFFSCELPLIFGVGENLKKRLEIFRRGTQISNLNEIGRLVQALRSVTDRQRHTHFSKTYFSTVGVMQNKRIIKKSKSNFLTIVILPSLLMSLESKKNLLGLMNIYNKERYSGYLKQVGNSLRIEIKTACCKISFTKSHRRYGK